jgi:hypothetical protein
MIGVWGGDSVGGAGDSQVAVQPFISFSDGDVKPVYSVSHAPYTTCFLTCDGKVLCVGDNTGGKLGIESSSILSLGQNTADKLSSKYVAFDPANIVAANAAISTTLLTLVESSGRLSGFVPRTTFYMLSTYDSAWSVASFTAFPTAATLILNGDPLLTSVTLSPLRLNRVSNT